ncbi:GyrI-like domain-containing protein [Mangrovimonas sp. AS39]|uniref:GyrI-like domain-containing protein n=1 Tax=Mangrovimonas futianensis TaxID=2895523 RepID=UPI001E459973|nr:GyrI-like domain-containing protein [Mangrovimonas futianensis]MCF1192949.1 GyrI-like domain-containing protein [Mangrovimonas futianensis]MCF1196640.1 GyrI-like domain-containing protein [Mangrovimonas futianensis]
MSYKHQVFQVEDIKVVGVHAPATFQTIAHVTGNLARAFMPRRKEIENRIGTHSFSIQDYDAVLNNISPQTSFEKWVGVEVSDFENVPEGMNPLVLQGGAYLVIDFEGSPSDFPKLWQFILQEWLPSSNYKLDERPHFEKLPKTYNPLNPINKEEVWVPLELE